MIASTERFVQEGFVQEDRQSIDSGSANALATDVADAVRRHMAGDRQAMTEIVRSVTPWLCALVGGYRFSTYTAEDVVQNTLLTLMQKVQDLRNPQCALSWISVIARREALRAIKAERRVEPVKEIEELGSLERDDPEQIMLARAQRRSIHESLAQLPGRNRALLRLAFLTDVRDYASISAALDMPMGSIGPTRRRSLDRMRVLLGPR